MAMITVEIKHNPALSKHMSDMCFDENEFTDECCSLRNVERTQPKHDVELSLLTMPESDYLPNSEACLSGERGWWALWWSLWRVTD